jgi:transposase
MIPLLINGGVKMFFREKKSKTSKTSILQLVDTVRTGKGPRQRVVVSLGSQFRLPKEQRHTVARLVQERLLGQQSLLATEASLLVYVDNVIKKIQTEGKWNSSRTVVEKTVRTSVETPSGQASKESQTSRAPGAAPAAITAEVFVDDVQHGYDRELGPVLIGHAFWKRLDFPTILQTCGFQPSQIHSAELSVLNRLIAQDSEHALLSWLKTVAVEELLDIQVEHFGDDRFYRISDKLLHHQDTIETHLYHREHDLFNLSNSIFLYDLTNTYFEGSAASNPKAEYHGTQKEKRTDCPQVVVALVVDREGFIRRHRMFNGKMTDAKSLKHIITALHNEFQDRPLPTLIFDRGVVSEENMQLLASYPHLKYVVACRVSEEASVVDDFKTQPFCEVEGREAKGNSKVEVFLKEHEGMVYLLCKSQGRKAKETAMRNSLEGKLEAELVNLKTQIHKGRENDPVNIERRIGRVKERYASVAKYFTITYTHREFSYRIAPETRLPKRLATSLQTLQRNVDANTISFPALEKKLASFAEKYPEAYGNLQIHLKAPGLSWETIDEIEHQQRELDGNYLLKTNRRDVQHHEIWHLYMTLSRMEQAFRDLKTHLGLRPVYHQKELRVDGHIFLSILAYHLLHTIEYTLRQHGDHSRWATIKRLVSTHRYSTMQLPTVAGPVLNIRKPGMPEGIHQAIYNTLGVDWKQLPIKKIFA